MGVPVHSGSAASYFTETLQKGEEKKKEKNAINILATGDDGGHPKHTLQSL